MKSVLEKAWDGVRKSYGEHRINSERALQSILYHEIITSEGFNSEDRILIEPNIGPLRPDIVVIGKNDVKCIIEIKCSPHNIFKEGCIKADIDKLIRYSKLSIFNLNDFGPNRYFDRINKRWHPMTQDQIIPITQSTIFCFAVVALKEDNVFNFIEAYSVPKNTILMAGEISPSKTITESKYEFYVKPLNSGA
jgi:hypothetical protein